MNPARQRKDRITAAGVRFFSFAPLTALFLVLLFIVDSSMGTAVRLGDKVLRQWSLSESLLDTESIRASAAALGPEAEIFFRFGPSPAFLFSKDAGPGGSAGLLIAAAGSLWTVPLGLLLAFIPALLTALRLDHGSRLTVAPGVWMKFLRSVMNLFVRVPLVLYGVFFLPVISRVRLDYGETGFRNLGNATLLTALIAMPRMIEMMEREIARVPGEIRTASYALGARWTTVVFRQLLPASISFIAAGTLRLSARMFGVAAPFIVLGVPNFLSAPPSGPGDRFTNLPVQIFQWASRSDGIYRNMAASAALILLIIVFGIEILAAMWRSHLLRRSEGLR